MSYSRLVQFDAYIYQHIEHGLVCDWCSLISQDRFIAGSNVHAMLEHIAEHRSAGDALPDGIENHIRADFTGGEQA